MDSFGASFEAPIHHGAIVISANGDHSELSDWDSSIHPAFRSSQSLIFGVQSAVDGIVRCEIWTNAVPGVLGKFHRIASEVMDFSPGWRVWDPEGVIQVSMRSLGEQVVSVYVDNIEWPEVALIVVHSPE